MARDTFANVNKHTAYTAAIINANDMTKMTIMSKVISRYNTECKRYPPMLQFENRKGCIIQRLGLTDENKPIKMATIIGTKAASAV